MFAEMANLQKNEETSRIGKKWLQEEDDKLLRELYDKKTYEEIALNHKRTIRGIKSRVVCNILYLQYKNKTKTIEELALEYNIENDLVIKYINKMENKESNDLIEKNTEKQDYQIKSNVNIELLYDKIISLETKMLTIEQKLDSIITLISAQKT
jgi:coproporphyrinogen III oxidase